MHAAVPPLLVNAARVIAIAGVVQGAVYFLFGFESFETATRVPVALWVAAPLPLAYWIGRKIARRRMTFAIVLSAMAIVFAVSVWAYWEITWGETNRTESLAGLLFLFGPLYQYALLAAALLVAWLVGRASTSA